MHGFLANLEQKVDEKKNTTIKATIDEVVAARLKEIEKQERVKKKDEGHKTLFRYLEPIDGAYAE